MTNELEKLIIGIGDKSKIVGLTMVTEPAMKKTGNPYYGKITKKTTGTCSTSFDYERIKKEMCGQDAEVQLSWHRHITKNLVIDRKTESKLYLYAKPLKLNSTYYFEGKKIDKSKIKPYLRNRGNSVFMVNLDNITRIRVNGKTFVK